MKTLYYLKRDWPHINCGFIDKSDEIIREVFDNNGVPQPFYIKDGKVYYQWSQFLYVNNAMEFITRHEELAVEGAYKELRLPQEGYLIYIEYWMSHVGLFAKNLFRQYQINIRNLDADRKYLSYYDPIMMWYRDQFWFTLGKTAGKNFILKVILPALILIYLVVRTTIRMISYVIWRCTKSKAE